jgi:hypothetical protein
MTEHFTKNTVSATFWCGKCGKRTQHRVDAGRKGPCLECMDGPKAQEAVKPPRKVVVLRCTCRSFRYPHPPEEHKKLPDGDLDWRGWWERTNEVFEERIR